MRNNLPVTNQEYILKDMWREIKQGKAWTGSVKNRCKDAWRTMNEIISPAKQIAMLRHNHHRIPLSLNMTTHRKMP